MVAAADNEAVWERRGETIVIKYYGRCHATGRTGASPHRGAPRFRTPAHRYPIERREEALGEGVVSGHPHVLEFRFSAWGPNYSMGYRVG